MPIAPLSKNESLFYRDQLRSARYAALADAEGFSEIVSRLKRSVCVCMENKQSSVAIKQKSRN